MSDQDMVTKMREIGAALQTLSVSLAAYENVVYNKEQQIKSLNLKLADVAAQVQQEQVKAGSYLSAASDEAAKMHKDAQEAVGRAQRLLDDAHVAKALADVSIQEAKQRSVKLEADERAFKMTQQIFDRKKAALEKALGE